MKSNHKNQKSPLLEALAKWDAGRPVLTVEMGGLGPGYEQCIHIVVFELVRRLHAHWPAPTKDRRLEGAWNDCTSEIDTAHDLGLTGAQAGAAKALAYRFITEGYDKVMKKIPDARRIVVSKAWPSADPIKRRKASR